MKTTRITVTEKQAHTIAADLLVYFLAQTEQEKGKAPQCDVIIQKQIQKAFDLGDFSGKDGETFMYYPSSEGKTTVQARRIMIMGMGKIAQEAASPTVYETLRKIGGSLAGTCKKVNAKIITVCLPDINLISPEKTAQCLLEGILLGDYRFEKYKETTRKKTDYPGLTLIRLSGLNSVKSVRAGVKKGQIAADAACEARNMANEPGNGWTSKEFSDYAENLASEYGLKFTCLEKKDMKRLGMEGILAVNQGSAIPPRMVILEHKPKKKSNTLLLVGKGLTFDSGGINIKPSDGMEKMKYDMCGGAAVLAAMKAVGEEKPDVGVVAIVPATDNMPGSSALRPGDIIRHFNGVTSEIMDTDAEGRIILADALAYGIKTFKPDGVVDIATLTGSIIIGLGHHYAGMISNNDQLSKCLVTAGEEAGEPLWRLPLNKAYKKQIESQIADIKNLGDKSGGSITAAAYLSEFVGNTPWVHLDIAGTAWDFTEKSYVPKGPSGFGVRLFIHLIRSWKIQERIL